MIVQGSTQNQPHHLAASKHPSDAKVEYHPETDCFEYNAPGYHSTVCKNNPVKEGLVGAVFVGVPGLIGATEKHFLGAAGSVGLTALVSPTVGAVLGGAALGYATWKESNENPLYTGLAALVGAGVGAVAFPLLKLPGAGGGFAGAAAAAGAVGVGVAVWQTLQNHKIEEEARAHGYQG